MIKKALFILLAAVVLHSCNFSTTGTWKNETIQESKRKRIKTLNNKLFEALFTNDAEKLKELMSDTLKRSFGEESINSLQQLNASYKPETYTVLDEYNVSNAKAGMENVLKTTDGNDHDYEVNYLALNKEMYVSLLLAPDKENDLLITVVYGKYADDWKINVLRFGEYRVAGKTTPDYYSLAKTANSKGQLVNAVNYMILSNQLSRPAGDLFQFKKDKEMAEFYSKLLREADAQYRFPMPLVNVETHPKIYKMSPQITREGVFPSIHYISDININSEAQLKAENELVKKEVSRLFPGIDQDKKYIFYWVINGLPDGNKVMEQYGFIDTLKVNTAL